VDSYEVYEDLYRVFLQEYQKDLEDDMATIGLEDFNGDYFLGTREGEEMEEVPVNNVLFGSDIPRASQFGAEVPFDVDSASAFLADQMMHLSMQASPMPVDQQGAVAFMRLLAVKHGLVSPLFDHTVQNLKYNDAVPLSQAQTEALRNRNTYLTKEGVSAVVTPMMRKDIRTTFADRVCMVAFMFRARGHHYMDSLDAVYANLWKKCRYSENQVHATWQNVSCAALHAIFPENLEKFWFRMVSESKCNGALAKRYDVAAAGTAGPLVVLQGLIDIKMVAPGIERRCENEINELNRMIVDIRSHRYAGSVNRKYYGAPTVFINEKAISAIAAVIRSALQTLAADAPLGKSPALQRIANNAPITGAVLGQAIGQIARREETINGLLEL